MGAFDNPNLASMPVGAVIQSPLNLESMTNGQWIALDGRDCNRADYPLIQSQFPAGVFTSTARTLAAAPAAAVITADAGNFYAAGVSSASSQPLQCSTDGVSWTASPTAGISGWASVSTASVILAGPRVVVAGGGPACVIAANTNPTLLANWTATTGGTTTTLTQGLAYGSTANAGAGRTVLVKNGSLATASGIFYLNDGSTAWSAASGGSTADRVGVCWTGQKFICTTITGGIPYQSSTDGATWSDGMFPFPIVNTVQNSIASDGNGTVVISTNSNASMFFIVSKDHGATWRKVIVPPSLRLLASIGTPSNFTYTLSYVNGKFIAFGGASAAVPLTSLDGLTWQADPIQLRGAGNTIAGAALYQTTYKAGTYCTVGITTSAMTYTENTAKFKLPESCAMPAGNNANFGDSAPLWQEYIKVRN